MSALAAVGLIIPPVSLGGLKGEFRFPGHHTKLAITLNIFGGLFPGSLRLLSDKVLFLLFGIHCCPSVFIFYVDL
jgi:hypothetical protein